MKDAISKQVGPPYSTSRSFEKAMKKRTHKKRRQEGRKACTKNL
jgi:hypothetical protein